MKLMWITDYLVLRDRFVIWPIEIESDWSVERNKNHVTAIAIYSIAWPYQWYFYISFSFFCLNCCCNKLKRAHIIENYVNCELNWIWFEYVVFSFCRINTIADRIQLIFITIDIDDVLNKAKFNIL